MGANENIAVVKRLYDAFERGDGATVTETFADDVVWHEGGAHQLAGEYRGLEGVMAVNSRAAELSGGTLQLSVHDILGSDDHVVVLQQVTASVDGVEHRLEEILVVHMDGGKVTEVWVAYADPQAAVALFG